MGVRVNTTLVKSLHDQPAAGDPHTGEHYTGGDWAVRVTVDQLPPASGKAKGGASRTPPPPDSISLLVHLTTVGKGTGISAPSVRQGGGGARARAKALWSPSAAAPVWWGSGH